MEYQNGAIVQLVLRDLLKEFDGRLRMRMLELSVPERLMREVETLSFQNIFAGELPQPKRQKIWYEDPDPVNIMPDANANFSLDFVNEPDGPVFSQTEQMNSQLMSNESEVLKTRRSKKPLLKCSQTAATDRGVFALSEPVLTEQEQKLQKDIDKVKNKLYYMRKLRKQNEEEERLRFEELMNKSSKELPSHDFAYDINGDFLRREKAGLKRSLAIQPGGSSVDIKAVQKRKVKKVMDNEEQDRDNLMSRDQGGATRQRKRKMFDNMNKRQVSHLPFIKLAEKSKLTENNRTSNGLQTSQHTMKSVMSRGEGSFRSYAQIQREKTERLYSLKKSEVMSEMTEDEVEPLQVTFSHQKKQSKRMKKYLQKLYEDKNKNFVNQINKSCNFDRLNSPHEYSVHRYYRHNFDEDKRSYCQTSLASLKLNTSNFREVKLNQ